MIDNIFNNKAPNFESLITYGFKSESNGYFYTVKILENQFLMTIKVSNDKDILTKVIEISSNEEYTLHKVQGVMGGFVGKVKAEYEDVLLDIAQKCFEKEVFKSENARQVIEYVRKTYGDELEFLWKKTPDCAIFRRKDNKKWYGAILTISKRKIGLDNDDFVEIIDLRGNPDWISEHVDNIKYFPGYHMNKKHWFTFCLENSISLNEIFEKIDVSFDIAKKK